MVLVDISTLFLFILYYMIKDYVLLIFCILLISKFIWSDPDVILYNGLDEYLRRWHVIPRNRYFNMYIHKFVSSDIDRNLHDHPWSSVSLLFGDYNEIMPRDENKWKNNYDREEIKILRRKYSIIYRSAESIHRIELINNNPVWTLFITGPKVREWGFWCKDSFKHYIDYLKIVDHRTGGRQGCD